MKLMPRFYRVADTSRVTGLSRPPLGEVPMVRKRNRIRPLIAVLIVGMLPLVEVPAFYSLLLPAPAMAGQTIPPYAIEASALLHQIKQRVPDLRSAKFDQIYETPDKRNTRSDAIPFTATGTLCRLESKDAYCIAFEIDAEVNQRPAVMEQIKKIMTDPCVEIDYPTKTFSDSDMGKPDYWKQQLDYGFRFDEVKRIHTFFRCAESKRTHYEIVINVVKNLDDWITPRFSRGAEMKKKLQGNLVEQIVVPAY